MAINQGDVFGAGIKLVLVAPNTALAVSAGPVAYIRFVDANGDDIVPTYEPDGYRTSAGPLSGAKVIIAGPTRDEFSRLQERVAALEAVLVRSGDDVTIKPGGATGTVSIHNAADQPIFEAGGFAGVQKLGFFGRPPAEQGVITGDWNSGAPNAAGLTEGLGTFVSALKFTEGYGLINDHRSNLP